MIPVEFKDSACIEQMPIAIQSVYKDYTINEDFFGYTRFQEGLSSRQVAIGILGSVKELRLDMNDCLGQAYNDAGDIGSFQTQLQLQMANI